MALSRSNPQISQIHDHIVRHLARFRPIHKANLDYGFRQGLTIHLWSVQKWGTSQKVKVCCIFGVNFP